MKEAKAGPQPLTIEEYRSKQQKTIQPQAPPLNQPTKPKRRGGYTARRRQLRARLLRTINSDPPPSWERASELWIQINTLEEEIENYLRQQAMTISIN